jgi:hypothetical protein
MEIENKFISKRICRCFFSLVGTLLKLNEVKLQGLVVTVIYIIIGIPM